MGAKRHHIFHVPQLKKSIGTYFPLTEIPRYLVIEEQLFEPEAVVDTKIVTEGDSAYSPTLNSYSSEKVNPLMRQLD